MGHGRSQEQGVVVDEPKYQEPNDRVFPAVKEFKSQIGEALYLLLIIMLDTLLECLSLLMLSRPPQTGAIFILWY